MKWARGIDDEKNEKKNKTENINAYFVFARDLNTVLCVWPKG